MTRAPLRRHRRVEIGSGRHEDVCAAVLDLEPLELPVGDEAVEGGADPGGAAPQPPVLDDRRRGERAAGAHGLQRRASASRSGSVGTGASSTSFGRTRSGRS